MAKQSTLDPDDFPDQDAPEQPKGRDIRSLGPSNSSDTGADMIGPGLVDDDALALDLGTNEDAEEGHLGAGKEPDIRMGGDIAPDRIVGPEEAGLGTGLDEAEEALADAQDESDGAS